MKAINAYLLKVTGLAAIVLSLYSTGFAQQGEDRDTTAKKFGDNEEIIIKPKTDVEVKLNVEIKKDGKVFVNGKPVDEFEDDNVSVHKKKIMIMDGRTFSIAGLDGPRHLEEFMNPRSRGKGGDWNYEGVKLNRAFLGVNSGKAGDNAEGARVMGVTKGSAAEKAGLKEGDLITRVDEIAISDPQGLVDAIHKYKPEDKIILIYKRDGKEQRTTATLGKLRADDDFNYSYPMPKVEGFNFRVRPVPPYGDGPGAFSWNDSRPKLGIKAQDTEDGKGAKVLDVDDKSPADKAGIKEGDIITRFEGKNVDNATTLADLARESRGKASIKISLVRDGKSQEIEVKVPRKLKTADL